MQTHSYTKTCTGASATSADPGVGVLIGGPATLGGFGGAGGAVSSGGGGSDCSIGGGGGGDGLGSEGGGRVGFVPGIIGGGGGY